MVGLLALLAASPAAACLEVPTARGMARTFDMADMVVDVEALTETYGSAPAGRELRDGVGTARVLTVHKGRVRKGAEITYRVLDGDGSGMTCPGRRFTRPGARYRLYLKSADDGSLPSIIFPTDAQPMPLR